MRSPYPIPRNAIRSGAGAGRLHRSGSAVATARGIVSFALGTDTAGSGRIPAGFNNIVGLKPTVGALSATGVVPACRTLDCVSIFALTVEDAYAVFAAACRHDAADPFSRDVKVSPLGAAAVLTVGVPRQADRKFFGDEEMRDGFGPALESLAGLGCKLVEIPFADFYATADLLYEGAWVAERYAAIASFMENHEQSMHPVTRRSSAAQVNSRRLTRSGASMRCRPSRQGSRR